MFGKKKKKSNAEINILTFQICINPMNIGYYTFRILKYVNCAELKMLKLNIA